MSDATKIHVGDVLAQALCDTTPRRLYERAIRAERRAEAAEARARAMHEVLEQYRVAAQGFAEAVREDTQTAYPWHPLDEAEKQARAALAQQPADPVVYQNDADPRHNAAFGLQDVGEQAAPGEPFQTRVWPWLIHCFGEAIARDVQERNHRFLEEALELVQSTGCTAREAHQLVDYVFGRPTCEPHQETGGVMVTLAALCLAHDLDMHAAGEDELTRVWGKADKIRAKQAAKPAHGPLPGPSEADQPAQGERNWLRETLDEAAAEVETWGPGMRKANAEKLRATQPAQGEPELVINKQPRGEREAASLVSPKDYANGYADALERVEQNCQRRAQLARTARDERNPNGFSWHVYNARAEAHDLNIRDIRNLRSDGSDR